MSSLHTRFQGLPARCLADELTLRKGTLADYAQLAEHHYKARKPATATRVLVLESSQPSVAERWRPITGSRTIVGVLVESLPSLSCRMRDWALHERYASHLAPGPRAKLLNDELRCISRVVIDPRWRGLGLAVRLVKHALAQPTTVYTEALAAMGRVNPFFTRAGMTAYVRPAHEHDARLTAALIRIGLAAEDLTRIAFVTKHLEQLTPALKRWFLHELKRWYRLNAGRSAHYNTDPEHQLIASRQRLLLEPVYYLRDNRPLSNHSSSKKPQ